MDAPERAVWRALASVSALACTLVAHLVPVRAAAQDADGPRRGAAQATTWAQYMGEHVLSRRWALWTELQVRRTGGTAALEEWQQLLVRPGVLYTIAPGVRAGAGYAWIDTWPYGEQPIAARAGEHRAWQQLQLAHETGRVEWQHRLRFEQRWLETPVADTGAVDTRYSNRGRLFARAALPLRPGTVADGAPYVTLSNEAFVNWGRNVGRNVFDQNRLFVGVGATVARGSRLELGYLQQLVLKPDGVQYERNHTLLLTWWHTTGRRR